MLYAPSYAFLVTGEDFWPLWSLPWLLIISGYLALHYWGAPDDALRQARLERAARYARALKVLGKDPSHEFCRRLMSATLIASLLFALCLSVLLMDIYRVTFKFFCVVYGVLLIVHLIRVAIQQDISVARANG